MSMDAYIEKIQEWASKQVEHDQGISLDDLIEILKKQNPSIKKKMLDEVREIILDLIDKKKILNVINENGSHLFKECK